MNETPEAVRDRIKAEELAKGSDPRVAEGRSKAAEMRTRLGLPIDPQEAWKARLAQEGGAPTAPAALEPEAPVAPVAPVAPAAPEPEPTGPAAPAADAGTPAPRTDNSPTHVPPDSSGLVESPAPSASAAPLEDQPQPQTPPPPPPEAGPAADVVPAPPTPVVPVFAPEIGEIIELEGEVVFSVGGVKVRDARIATWILILLLSIPLWAMLYLLGLGGGDVGRATTGCIVDADRSFVCFQPKHETGSGGGH